MRSLDLIGSVLYMKLTSGGHEAQSPFQELKMRYLKSKLLTNQERYTINIKVSWSEIANFCFTLKSQVESHKCETLEIIVSPMGNTLKKRDSKDSLFK